MAIQLNSRRTLSETLAAAGLRSMLVLAALLLDAPPGLAQSDTYYPLSIRQGWGPRCLTGKPAPFRLTVGVGKPLQGVGSALGNINGEGGPDLILMGLHDGPQQNEFRYRILWDIDGAGASVNPPSAVITAPGLGWEAQGAGAALTELDGDDRPELILLHYDNPPGANEFRYRVGWNLDVHGKAASWSPAITTSGLGNPAAGVSGSGADIGFVNGNDIPDLVLTATGAPTRYKIGFDLDATGKAASWSAPLTAPALGGTHTGGGALLSDIDLDGAPDLLLAAYRKGRGTQAGEFVYRIGWSLSQAGAAAEWSRAFRLSGFDTSAGGAGLAHVRNRDLGSVLVLADHKDVGSGEFDDIFRYNALPLTTSGIAFGAAMDPPPAVTNTVKVPTGWGDMTAERLFNLNMSTVRNAARDAVITFWFNALFPGSLDWHDHPDQSGNFALMLGLADANLAITPDFAVAAVAWYVDKNMGYSYDDVNEHVVNTIHGLSYALGGHNVPAHYTVRYTNPFEPANSALIPALQSKDPDWAKQYNDGKAFHGDCEDYAIFRHALLRSLGFDRRFIWNADSPSHEHNVVLYRGAYRIMDYGRIQSYLCCASSINNMIFQTWNSDFDLASNVDHEKAFWHYVAPRALPDRCGETGWLFSRHARPDLDGTCAQPCK